MADADGDDAEDDSVAADPKGPRPVKHEHVADPDIMMEVRRLHCRLYATCLQVACKNFWPGFSCRRCNVRDEINQHERRRDMEGMAAMFTRTGRKRAREALPTTAAPTRERSGSTATGKDGGPRTAINTSR